MKLDDRILCCHEAIYTPYDVDNLPQETIKALKGTKGYFACAFEQYSDLTNTQFGKLVVIDTREGAVRPWICENDDEEGGNAYQFFLPDYEVSQGVGRAFTIHEFADKFSIGDVIRIRKISLANPSKGDKDGNPMMIVGIDLHSNTVHIGACMYTVQDLIEYEYLDKDTNHWEVFGVVEHAEKHL